MSIRSKVLAVAVTLTLAGGVAAVATVPVNAETPECGSTCVELFSLSSPQLILNDQTQAQATGTPLTTSLPSNTDPGEDFTATESTVADYFEAGLVSDVVALHYGCDPGVDFFTCTPGVSANDLAFELVYSPFGAPTGMCAGIASTAVDGTAVSLQPCGASARTIWIVDSAASISSFYVPLISATDTNFSDPYVLTSTPGGASLMTEPLQENTVSGDQRWSWDTSLRVDALTVTTTSLPAATGGQPYSASLAAVNGVTPYSWSVSSGSLPPGLTLNSSTGQISGTPDVAGTYSFTVTVTDSRRPAMTDTSQPLSISVSGPVITAIRPDSGPVIGFTALEITGTGLSCPARAGCKVTVTFGGKATTANPVSSDEILADSPPATKAGTVTVTVTVDGVSSQATAATTFTYTGVL
jgi:hypothetical protein